ncbi:hypothetical protein CEXT_542141 [Caerostris extrusa]|uniref:Uncharacterized protein n=1 Tax=Caerostris extrusa TaxID=172846 RepID=A0AAV4N459_CAEEX|nr:hypothetical protein CEXT_542141 [Caerostris extrusa]
MLNFKSAYWIPLFTESDQETTVVFGRGVCLLPLSTADPLWMHIESARNGIHQISPFLVASAESFIPSFLNCWLAKFALEHMFVSTNAYF